MIARYAIPFFFLMGLLVAPLACYLITRWLLPKRVRRYTFLACTLLIWGTVAYGYLVGFQQLQVRHVEFASHDLPEAFDGYRIVQFSDAHIATCKGSKRWLLQRAVDSINAQRADAIVFTGDMQNIYPDELPPFAAILRQLKAKDGVYAVLGNHDYAVYQQGSESEKERRCQETIRNIREMGFDLLLNEHRTIFRPSQQSAANAPSTIGNASAPSTIGDASDSIVGNASTPSNIGNASDSIIIAGMENWGKAKRMPRRGDVGKTLAGVSDAAFVVMLQHDPTCWREKILAESRAQLTLSGHTHGGQASVFGWSPVSFSYNEWGGFYHEGERALYVSTGLGALIPFRLNQPGEIVVITLRKK